MVVSVLACSLCTQCEQMLYPDRTSNLDVVSWSGRFAVTRMAMSSDVAIAEQTLTREVLRWVQSLVRNS